MYNSYIIRKGLTFQVSYHPHFRGSCGSPAIVPSWINVYFVGPKSSFVCILWDQNLSPG